MSFREYVEHGWKLCYIQQGKKRPTDTAWNRLDRAITNAEHAANLQNAGLLHAFSGTCAIDLDNVDLARFWFRDRGIDLDALLADPKTVRIHSGDPKRGKMIFALPAATADLTLHAKTWPTKFIKNEDGTVNIMELRCGASTGNSAQDVLPPSLNPRTGQHYEWIGDWRNLPPLPEMLHKEWQKLVAPVERPAREALAPSAELDELRELIKDLDPDMTHDEWVKVGMALHKETGGSYEGLALWDEWSSKGSKYEGFDQLQYKWRTFRDDHPNPVTLGSLLWKRKVHDDPFLPAVQDRPVIRLDGGKLAEYAKRCEEILSDELYVRDHALVRIGAARELDTKCAREIRRVDAQPVIMQVSVEYLQRRLTERVRFERYDGRSQDYVQKDCPKNLASNIANYGEWPMMRALRSIATAPFIRPDKTVCTEPGYDERTRTFYAPNADFPAIPKHLTKEDAEKALATLLAPFAEFPFADEAHRGAFVSHILTEAVRLAIETSPIFAYTAPEAGSGKSLLSEMPGSIVHGMTPAMRAWASDGDELRKVIFASLLAGDRTIGFDNIPSGSRVRAAELCRFATSITYSDRKLGVSETAAMPNTSVVFLTGNNITPVGDLARRSVVVRLDANVDSHTLRTRQFAIPHLRDYVSAHRAELLVAALTIVRAFVTADAPAQTTALPSFEQWSRLVRDPLVWLGLPDPVVTQDQETDNEAQPLGAVFDAIARWRGDQWFMSHELHAQAMLDEPIGEALVAAGCDISDVKRVGMWLNGHRGRVVDGMKLEALRAKSKNTNQWRLAGAENLDLIG